MNTESTQGQQALESTPAPKATISDREKQIIELIADGLNSTAIAAQLHISAKTVEAHRHNILKKTACNNSAQLIRYSVRNGIIE